MKNLVEIPLKLTAKIYRSPMPFGRYDLNFSTFQEYKDQNISVVVILVSDLEALEKSGKNLTELYTDNNIEVISMPIADFSVPDKNILHSNVNTVLNLLKSGKNIAVHCNAGLGRTGMFLACISKQTLNLTGFEAINYIRGFVADAIETAEQEAVVINF